MTLGKPSIQPNPAHKGGTRYLDLDGKEISEAEYKTKQQEIYEHAERTVAESNKRAAQKAAEKSKE